MARERIAILGGGAAALAAAFDLTSEPDWQDRYEITVYTQGWRLGGKGASSRDVERGGRIVEHGLHVLLGYYNHTFRMMRQVYERLDRPADAPFPTWRSAVAPLNRTAVMEQVDGEWVPWDLVFPRVPGMPGEGDVGLPDAGQCLRRLMGWIVTVGVGRTPVGADADGSPRPKAADYVRSFFQRRLERLQLWGPDDAEIEALIASAAALGEEPPKAPARTGQDLGWPVAQNLLQLGQLAQEALARSPSAGLHARRLLTALDLACAAVRGMVADRVLTRGFDPLDGEELRDWLVRHGAARTSVDSTLVRSVYDLTFAYREGDPDQPALAAGAGLRGALRLFFGYRGGFLWKMQAGMGDVVFAPLYQCLAARGVRFRFFHQVRALEARKGRIDRVRIGRQATPTGDYAPLIDVDGLPCWPMTPNWSQLAEGETLRARGIDLEDAWSGWSDVETLELRADRDFDRIVLGISLGALPAICQDLAARKKRWRRLLERVGTVPTQSVQLWLLAPTAELGWRPDGTILAGFSDPFDSWADMSHLLATETWPEPAPQQVSYLLGAMRDDGAALMAASDDYPVRAQDLVRDQLITWLDQDSGGIWPDAQRRDGRGFRWNLLVDPHQRRGPDRLEHHVIRANVQPSDRYVQTLPGATRARLRPGHTGFSNLWVCGDWTRNGMNVGSVEAAVLSGLIAGRLIRGQTQLLPGESDG